MAIDEKREGLLLCGLVLLAALLWYVIFGMPDFGNFWVKISISAASLAILSLLVMGGEREKSFEFKMRYLWLGIGSALLLYLLFAVGDWVMKSLFPELAPHEIASVYGRKEGTSPWVIAALLLLVTGPSEEIFWRGFLQRLLTRKVGPMTGLVLATVIYAGVHIWTLNLSLILAAFTAGLVWGWIYLTERSLVPVIISHSIWSATIFVFLPLQ
ncbi:CPBP family intramembrane metalloprotease [Candidatus Acetothermia bacterium]|nr:CPBP family intramembrane metalloprotease [Candidatus Acetothermia bacterium]MBI3642572.1 CPBP family intramembrane metalloprotease [Candidatus Acetothermia bacterium]